MQMTATIGTIILVGIITAVIKIKYKIHFLLKKQKWSIGIYVGYSPYHFMPTKNIKNPVLTAKSVIDRKVEFIADPFMIREENNWYMFFEVMDISENKGEIGLAESRDGLHWAYRQIVLSEPFHLSYPYIFKWENEFYMIPETYVKKAIRLYKASSFPKRWEYIGDLLAGFDFVDSSIFFYNDKLWLFTCPTINSDILQLFYADNLKGPWLEHPSSPIVTGNAHIARCGGRVLILDDKIIRYAQDDHPVYGSCLHAFEITKLTTIDYKEKEYPQNPILKASGKGWNKEGMHNIDLHLNDDGRWIACVDGFVTRICFNVTFKNLLLR